MQAAVSFVKREMNLFSVDDSIAALVSALLRVSIESLQQRTATAERQVVCAPAALHHRRQHSVQRVDVDAVSLNNAQIRRQHLEAFAVRGSSEFAAQNIKHLQQLNNAQ